MPRDLAEHATKQTTVRFDALAHLRVQSPELFGCRRVLLGECLVEHLAVEDDDRLGDGLDQPCFEPK